MSTTINSIYITTTSSTIPKQKQKQKQKKKNGVSYHHHHRHCFFTAISSLTSSATSATSATASATTPESINKVTYTADENEGQVSSLLGLGCPVCYDPLTSNNTHQTDSPLSLNVCRESMLAKGTGTGTGTSLQCSTCKKVYYSNEDGLYFDLTTASTAKDYVESQPLVTQFFSTQFMSYLYERGWRQNFGIGGYPGPDKEFEMAKEYLKPVLGGNIVDASCGSGVFSRRFSKSGLFSLVVALDYSGAMLKQCYDFVKEDPDFPKEKLVLVRADISRLPFVSQSVDAVHAGAALHCWPSPSAAVAEICRVLRPGGVFVATTTIADGPFALLPFRGLFRENLQQFSGSRIFLSERELEDLCATCGLESFACTRNGPFIMISATKPC